MILGTLLVFALSTLRKQVDRSFGKDVGTMFIIICTVQFHFIFYISRTLPNTFALFLGMNRFKMSI